MANRTAPVATQTEGEVKKRRRASGPRRTADTHVFVKVLDEHGQHLPNARLDIAHTTKDAKAALDFMDGPNGRDYKRFIVKGKQVGEGAKPEGEDEADAEVTQD